MHTFNTCVLQTGGGLEPQPNGESPQVAVIIRPGKEGSCTAFMGGEVCVFKLEGGGVV